MSTYPASEHLGLQAESLGCPLGRARQSGVVFWAVWRWMPARRRVVRVQGGARPTPCLGSLQPRASASGGRRAPGRRERRAHRTAAAWATGATAWSRPNRRRPCSRGTPSGLRGWLGRTPGLGSSLRPGSRWDKEPDSHCAPTPGSAPGPLPVRERPCRRECPGTAGSGRERNPTLRSR